MKQKLSATIDEEKVVFVNGVLKKDFFRNKSHVLEFAFPKLFGEYCSNLSNKIQ